MLPYLGNQPLHDELKLTEDQVRKLQDFQTAWLSDYFTALTDSSPEGLKARDELLRKTEKFFADTLKPDQLKRLNQIGLQRVAQSAERTGTARLLGQSALDELKLSDDQKKKLADNARLADVLTAAQQAKWKELLGTPFTGELRPTFATGPGGGPGGFGTRTASEIVYLQQVSVQEDLKLTDKQKERVMTLAQGRQTVTDPVLGEFLEPAQLKRLKQIMLQNQVRTSGTASVLTSAAVGQQLGLSEEQKSKRDAILTKYAADFRKAILSGDPADKIQARAADLKKTMEADLLAVLDGKQQAKWKELLGTLFTGNLSRMSRFGGPGGGGPPGGGFPSGTERTTPSLYGFLLSYLAEKAVQDELKLSADQTKKIAEYTQKWLANRDPVEKVKVIRDILTPEQFKRYEQVLLQLTERRSPGSAARITEIAQQLRITPEQQEKLAANEDPAKVLTEQQQAKLKELSGEPFQGELSAAAAAGRPNLPGSPPATGFGGTARTPAAPLNLRYLEEESVQKDLQLTEDQVKRLKEVEQKRLALLKGYADLTRDQQTAKRREASEAVDKMIGEILKPEQARRLKQITLQQTATPLEGAVLLGADVAAVLKLTPEQQDQLKAIDADASRVRSLITRERFSSVAAVANELTTLTADYRKQTEDKLLAVLTVEQKQAWKELLGTPFQGRLPRGFGSFTPSR
jgi:hypothetical protein